MQIRVKNINPAPAYDLQALKDAFNSTATTQGAFEASQTTVIVPQAGYDSAYNASFATPTYDGFVRIDDSDMTFTPIGSATPVNIQFKAKTIQDEMGEAFEKEYGRMSAMLGLELPKTQAFMQTMLLYNYPDPPTEIIKPSMSMTPIGTLEDGTQIWKITHNGVDTHPLHWHMFEVQLINRVAWDNNTRQPDLNELGWKETLRINPLQDTIVALRPIIPDLPFDLPNSIRLLDVTKPEGAVLKLEDEIFDPTGQPVRVVNHKVNFGWEYVLHCHILAHEENDMMRPMILAVTPDVPSNLNATNAPLAKQKRVRLTWTDNSTNEIGFIVQRASAAAGPWTTIATVPSDTGPATGTIVTWFDKIVTGGKTYYYQVIASNIVGDTWDYGTLGFPTMAADSAPSSTASVTVQ